MKPSVAFVAQQALTAQKGKNQKPKARKETKKKFDRWKELNEKLTRYWGQERFVPAKV
jgi:hypothetical protein